MDFKKSLADIFRQISDKIIESNNIKNMQRQFYYMMSTFTLI